MTNPYRAMCAQLVDLLQPHVTKADSEISALGYYSQAQQFIDRTRCHLARSVDDDRRALEQTPRRPVDAMTNLSPAAQAVLDAAEYENSSNDPASIIAAAALRAAADHIDHDWSAFNCVDALCEIAAELEGAQ